MGDNIDSDAIATAYAQVRDDANVDTTWAAFGYDGKRIVYLTQGSDYDEFLTLCTDDDRVYGYIRVETGDEMSRRAKFAFITWIGPSVSPLKKAKVSTDKAFVKEIVTNFGKEFLCDSKDELTLKKITEVLEKASGAAYGTGK